MSFPKVWGHDPAYADVVLVRGQDFAQIIDAPANEFFPGGSACRYDFFDDSAGDSFDGPSGDLIDTWSGQVSPELIQFRIESSRTDLIPAQCSVYLYISDPDSPTLDLCWTVGKVIRK